MRLAPEDGQALDVMEPEVKEGAVVPVATVPPSRSALVQELLQQALLGVLPVRRPLKPEEPAKFTPIHLCYVFDHANGMRAFEIAKHYGHHENTVRRILNHPFTEVLEAALAGQMADKLTDPLERMRAYAHEAIDVKVQILRDPSTAKSLRNTVAGDFLDRVGLGPRRQVGEDKPVGATPVPEKLLSRFTDALEESNRIRNTTDFSKFVKLGEGGGAVKVVPAEERSPATTKQDSGGASPARDPLPSSQKEKVA